ncbi:unnamed protein product [Medioppia subpectinata]|uniref:DUF4757 domain-containing protein n=1 Tax=Medioppia subpectinata TaxID=1979941 RepID=A0A7R9L6E7_9ACAR|nr:unnamed protein product [Medioppia subpectinata]CAG2116191.1 unnamed protein product [Medioppia subpectinata]
MAEPTTSGGPKECHKYVQRVVHRTAEQIKLVEELKMTKEKIKEAEEEWQNSLHSWKSKRRQSKNSEEGKPITTKVTICLRLNGSKYVCTTMVM